MTMPVKATLDLWTKRGVLRKSTINKKHFYEIIQNGDTKLELKNTVTHDTPETVEHRKWFIDLWNEKCRPAGLSGSRNDGATPPKVCIRFRNRWRENPDRKVFERLIDNILKSPNLLGKNKSGWKETLFHALEQERFDMILQGNWVEDTDPEMTFAEE